MHTWWWTCPNAHRNLFCRSIHHKLWFFKSKLIITVLHINWSFTVPAKNELSCTAQKRTKILLLIRINYSYILFKCSIMLLFLTLINFWKMALKRRIFPMVKNLFFKLFKTWKVVLNSLISGINLFLNRCIFILIRVSNRNKWLFYSVWQNIISIAISWLISYLWQFYHWIFWTPNNLIWI